MKKVVICLLSMFLFTCDLFQKDNEVKQVSKMNVVGDSFTISWDMNTLYDSDYINNATKYKVYYRIHGSSSWTLLDEIESVDDIEYTITNTALAYGDYDLGVSSVNGLETESEIHCSLDNTADPDSGWYISWTASN